MEALPLLDAPPEQNCRSYIVDQLEGERISIPGSKGTFRILASSTQTDGGIAVFSSGAVLSDAPGFHWHAEAHDVFLVTKGFMRLWNGDRCKVLGAGDFAYVPPVSLLQTRQQVKNQNHFHVRLTDFSHVLHRTSSTTLSPSARTPSNLASLRQATGSTSFVTSVRHIRASYYLSMTTEISSLY
jgi:mannose-6-phosphate isomerase-like protein (cupin superfamily)